MSGPPSPPSKPRCAQCKGWALKKPDPDGVTRCYGHSTDPENIAKRQANAAEGKAVGERIRGVPYDKRAEAAAGVIPLDRARADHIADKARKAKAEEPEAEAVDLDSKARILGALGKAMGRLNKGQLDAQEANAVAALARAALAVLGADIAEDDDEAEEGPRGFGYQTTEGEGVKLRGRG